MDALPFDPLSFVAIDRARNLRRRWRVQASRDLFGVLVVATDWGRIGTRGQALTKSFADEDAARAYVRALLRRRAGARRRIGVSYEPTCRHPDMTT